MEYIKTKINGLVIINPPCFSDSRGNFIIPYNEKSFNSNIGNVHFIQENQSISKKGVIRALHYQKGEYAQAKLVRVVKGAVIDVAVDLRKNSPTFGKHIAVRLDEENKKLFFIPRGFAHGFIALEEDTIFSYKIDNEYSPENEAGIVYNDPILNIDWGIVDAEINVAERDMKLPRFKEITSFF